MRKQIAIEEDGTIVYQQCAWCGEEEVEDWIVAGTLNDIFCSKECLENFKKQFPQWFKEVKQKRKTK